MIDHQINNALHHITYFNRVMDHDLITAAASKRTLTSARLAAAGAAKNVSLFF